MKRADLFKNGEEFISSMEELINRYQKAMEMGISKAEYESSKYMKCLLCNPLNIVKNHGYYLQQTGREFTKSCKLMGCPWIVITGKNCDEQPHSVYTTTDKKIMRNRIRQLKNWIKIYKKYMEEQK